MNAQTVIFSVGLALFLVTTAAYLAVLAVSTWRKAKIETGLSIQCSSGDSEVMSFNYNFERGESEDSKQSKINEAFQRIQDRRDENHKKWLEMKANAIAKNEAKDPEALKMGPLAQESVKDNLREVQ